MSTLRQTSTLQLWPGFSEMDVGDTVYRSLLPHLILASTVAPRLLLTVTVFEYACEYRIERSISAHGRFLPICTQVYCSKSRPMCSTHGNMYETSTTTCLSRTSLKMSSRGSRVRSPLYSVIRSALPRRRPDHLQLRYMLATRLQSAFTDVSIVAPSSI